MHHSVHIFRVFVVAHVMRTLGEQYEIGSLSLANLMSDDVPKICNELFVVESDKGKTTAHNSCFINVHFCGIPSFVSIE